MRFPQPVLRKVARTRKLPSVRSFRVQAWAPQPVFPVPQPVLLAVLPKAKSVLVVVLRLFVVWGVDQFAPPSQDSSNWTLAVPPKAHAWVRKTSLRSTSMPWMAIV